jgi:hypothetical protein
MSYELYAAWVDSACLDETYALHEDIHYQGGGLFIPGPDYLNGLTAKETAELNEVGISSNDDYYNEIDQ